MHSLLLFNAYGSTQNEVLFHFQNQGTYSEGLKDISKATQCMHPRGMVGFQLF